MDHDPIFEKLTFRSGLEVENRLFRSNVSGRFDNYDGSGNYVRLNWEERFAKGGVGAIISSYTPVSVRGRILTHYAMIDHDDKIRFWREVGRRVHRHNNCKFIMQLSHSGRQQDQGGVENRYKKALSSTNTKDYFHGILCQAMTSGEIHEVVSQFGRAARRAQRAGLDGVELHGANGYLITQFLSSAINDRTDGYGGSLRNRYRFLREIIHCIRDHVGDGFHLQLKISAEDHNNALYPWMKRGNRLRDTIQLCQWAEQDGVDGLHISSGSIFPHPKNPPGDFPMRDAVDWYDVLLSSGVRTRFNYWIFTHWPFNSFFRWWWNVRRGVRFEKIQEGVNLYEAAEIKKKVSIPVICTGGFQHASVIRAAVRDKVDAVSMARPLIANPDLPKLFAAELDWSDAARAAAEGLSWPIRSRHPCSYCNKCLLNDLENPLGCYDLDRYGSYEEMIKEAMSVFHPSEFDEPPDDDEGEASQSVATPSNTSDADA
jgi:2,4-dienoyl-CoA reductase-like NADH-dependent reductase (Old Yellow Enzyme family)